MGWSAYALVFAAFFLTHSIPVRPPVKAWVSAKIGSRVFSALYSTLSLAMLVLLIWSAARAPFVMLWPQAIWQRHVVHVMMLLVCLILAFSIGRPNPFSFGGARNDRFDPAHAGIVRWTRHPILVALALWATAHLLPNGDLAHVILFGVLGSFAFAGPALIDKRKKREWGAAEWARRNTARLRAPRFQRPASWSGAVARFVIGIGLFVALLWAHPVVIGVSAL